MHINNLKLPDSLFLIYNSSIALSFKITHLSIIQTADL